MENTHILDDTSGLNKGDLTITPAIAGFLRETSRWAKFLAILGFIGIGFMVILGLFASSIFSMLPNAGTFPFPTVFLSAFYIAFGLLYFFPVYYLFSFSTNLSTALKQNDNFTLEKSFEYLKSHYKFIGIMMIIILSLYGLMFIFSIVAGGLAMLSQ